AAAQAGYLKAAHFTLANGTLRQGQGQGYASDPIFAMGLLGLDVENVQTYASGMDNVTVDARQARESITIRNSTFHESTDNISNRMRLFATLELVQTKAAI